MSTTTAADPRQHPQYGAKRKVRKNPLTSTIAPKDRRCALRVKIKSLAAEAKIIRKEEKGTRSLSQFLFLQAHRVGVVREQARLSQLALAFIKGHSYKDVEQPSKAKRLTTAQIVTIYKMVHQYGSGTGSINDTALLVMEWIKGLVNKQ